MTARVPAADEVEVKRTRHGPFERIVLIAPHPHRPAAQSVYRIGDTLIDSGGSRVAPALVRALAADPPRRVLLTHQHEDHVGGVGALRRAFGQLPVYAARNYLPLLSSALRIPDYRAQFWGQPESIPDAIGFDAGAEFEAAGIRLHTLETPGHTPFHITFVARMRDASYALTGDLFTSASPLAAWFESAAEDTARSCRSVARCGPDLHMLPTHGKTRANGAETLRALAALMDDKTAEVIAASERLGTRDHAPVARAVFGAENVLQARYSEGEYSFANFVRSVFEPVRSLPASRLAAE